MKIEEIVVKRLTELNYHISCAESMTGGMISSAIINVSGASNVIERSYVTYSHESKREILGVNMNTIEKYGVVSKEVALEMAKGLFRISNANVCVSVTGYASGYFCTKKIGKVCYTIMINKRSFVNTVIIKGSRNAVRKKTTTLILKQLNELLEAK